VHVIMATDGSRQSLTAARQFMDFADVSKVAEVSVVAVISPLATVPFANELGGDEPSEPAGLSFRAEAHTATGSSWRRSSSGASRKCTVASSAVRPQPRS
jgi:hypothetical protein